MARKINPTSDPAHKETEALLINLEKKLKRTYSKAYGDAAEKFMGYMASFQRKDEAHRADVSAGRWSEEEYTNWKRNQLLYGDTLAQIRDTLAADLQKTDKMAIQMVRDQQVDVYALNHNYGTYEIEHGAGVDTSYSLYDHDTVERLMKEDPQLLPKPSAKRQREIDAKDLKWNQQHLTSAFTASILSGDDIPTMAKRISLVAQMDQNSAIRNARTMCTGAENGGRMNAYKRAKGMGIDVKQQWVATLDGRTRDNHREVDGEIIEVGKKFSNGLRFPGDPQGPAYLVYNCFVGDTLVSTDCDIERSYCHEYKGKLVTIKTASGVQFTCTPNHPILTPTGWVRADGFHNGDHILVTNVSDSHIVRRNPNINHVFARIDAIHKFFDIADTERVPFLRVNFHGDRPTSDVEVVTHKGFLRRDRDTGKFKHTNKLRLKGSDFTLMSKSSFVEHFRCIRKTTFSFVSRFSETLAFFGWCLRHPHIHTFRPVANMDAVLPKYAINNLPRETMVRSELLDGLSGEVFIDDIISVNISYGSGHVYNLQTKNGYYYVSSMLPLNKNKCNGYAIIAKNCRCTTVAVVDGIDPMAFDKTDTLRRKLGNTEITYQQWKTEHLKEAEERRKAGESSATKVNREKVFSKEFAESLNALDEDEDTTKAIYKSMKDILKHRDGTEYEDMAFIYPDGTTDINTKFNRKKSSKPSHKMMKKYSQFPRGSVIAIHNHPNSTTPSRQDIKNARERGYKYGIVIGHNGMIIAYKPSQKTNVYDADLSLALLNRAIYNGDDDKIAQALEDMKKNGLEVRVIR